jgi:hypothetical protein
MAIHEMAADVLTDVPIGHAKEVDGRRRIDCSRHRCRALVPD